MNTEQIIAKIKQYQLASTFAGLALVLFIILFLRKEQIPRLQAEEQNLSEIYNTMISNQNEATGLEKQTKQLEDIIATIEKRLMDADEKSTNQNNFHQLIARFDGLRVINQSQGEIWEDKTPGRPEITLYSPFDYNLSIEGPFSSVVPFLQNLQAGQFFKPRKSSQPEGQSDEIDETGKFIIRVKTFRINNQSELGLDSVQLVLELSVLGNKVEEE